MTMYNWIVEVKTANGAASILVWIAGVGTAAAANEQAIIAAAGMGVQGPVAVGEPVNMGSN